MTAVFYIRWSCTDIHNTTDFDLHPGIIIYHTWKGPVMILKVVFLNIDDSTQSTDLGSYCIIMLCFRTDEIIQKAIREEFVNCTVITIAHRLNTIIDADRVLVCLFSSKTESLNQRHDEKCWI